MKRIGLLLVLAVVAACGSSVIAGSSDWAEPSRYSFVLDSRCGERALIGRFAVTVEDGLVSDVQALDGDAEAMLKWEGDGPVPTLGELIVEFDSARSRNADRTEISFDPADGHPILIEIDVSTTAIDDEACYTITEYSDTVDAKVESPPNPGELVVPECNDGGSCVAGFVLDDVFYALSCAAIREISVTDEVIGEGDIYGDSVTVNRIAGVEDSVIVAVSVPGGYCSEEDPDQRLTDWSMAFPEDADQEALSAAICVVGDLSAAQRLADRCHVNEPLLTCGAGPGFPAEVLDDLSVYPEPSATFGADIEAILGSDNPDDLIGWHVIVEDQLPDLNYVQLLLREEPVTGELQYLLDGGDVAFDAPRECSPVPIVENGAG